VGYDPAPLPGITAGGIWPRCSPIARHSRIFQSQSLTLQHQHQHQHICFFINIYIIFNIFNNTVSSSIINIVKNKSNKSSNSSHNHQQSKWFASAPLVYALKVQNSLPSRLSKPFVGKIYYYYYFNPNKIILTFQIKLIFYKDI
jgi:hypothetical protein